MTCCFLFFSCSRQGNVLKIKGSDTEVNISVLLSEAYFAQHPQMHLSVSGGGSGLGIASLLNGLSDIANSSRPMNAEEEALFREKKIEVIPFEFAYDALAIITHSSVRLDSLSVEEVKQIFKGNINNWQQLGLSKIPITIYGRQNNSGTHAYLKKKLGVQFSLHSKGMNGNAQILEAVKADKGGIGYVGAGYVIKNGKQSDSNIKILKIYLPSGKAYSPLDYEAVVKQDYYFQRPLYQYILKSSYPKAKPLLDFESSEAGQKIIVSNGYFPIKNSKQNEQ
ncbi:MAG: phosphate ABC transporter substrate-binding protein [Bacteroidia bacterium]|nr:phosphate ABC transporter substrate-binding protein [Bacteroidia bacterium]